MSSEDAEEYKFIRMQKRKLVYLKELAEKILDKNITNACFDLEGESKSSI